MEVEQLGIAQHWRVHSSFTVRGGLERKAKKPFLHRKKRKRENNEKKFSQVWYRSLKASKSPEGDFQGSRRKG